LKLFLRDVLLLNLASLAVSLLLYLAGRDFFISFLVVLMVLSAIFLILGGSIGFLLSSVSFPVLERFFRRRDAKLEMQTSEKDEAGKEKEGKLLKERIQRGKRLVILGFAVLIESFILGLLSTLI